MQPRVSCTRRVGHDALQLGGLGKVVPPAGGEQSPRSRDRRGDWERPERSHGLSVSHRTGDLAAHCVAAGSQGEYTLPESEDGGGVPADLRNLVELCPRQNARPVDTRPTGDDHNNTAAESGRRPETSLVEGALDGLQAITGARQGGRRRVSGGLTKGHSCATRLILTTREPYSERVGA